MKRIVWLASYPKSGNTWVRFLLANYLRQCDDGVDVDRLAFGQIASLRSLFDEWSGIESSDMTADEVDWCRADVFRAVAASVRTTVFLKTHDAWLRDALGHPLFPEDATLRVVYIVRNPLDVAVSLAHHLDLDVTEAVGWMCDDEFTLVRSRRGISPQLPQRVRSWSNHVKSWVDDSGLPLTLVRFEDLAREPAVTLSRILEEVGETVDPGRVAQAVRYASFDRLQRQERERGFPERRSKSSLFFRSGRIGDGQRELAAAQIERLHASHETVMRRLGYIDDGCARIACLHSLEA